MKNASIAFLVFFGTALGLMGFLFNQSDRPKPVPVVAAPVSKPSSNPSYFSAQTARSSYVRPAKADNGSPFPSESGYIAKYPQRFTDGYSSVTLDNSKNDFDAVVKLYALDSKPPIAASVFFIKARDSFTVKEIRAGRYDMRFRNLDNGTLSKSDPFTLKEVAIEGGVQFSQMKLTLYKVSNGNMTLHDIPEKDF
jgi:hypothetical protein